MPTDLHTEQEKSWMKKITFSYVSNKYSHVFKMKTKTNKI